VTCRLRMNLRRETVADRFDDLRPEFSSSGPKDAPEAGLSKVDYGSTPVIENSESNFRTGSKAEIPTETLPQAPAKAIAAAPERASRNAIRASANSCRAGIAMNWSRAQGSAAEMLESVSTDSRHYPQERGARFAERRWTLHGNAPHDAAPSLSASGSFARCAECWSGSGRGRSRGSPAFRHARN
jgi:hypothetical protein